MIGAGIIDQGIRAAGSRYMLCVLAAQRAKQIYRRRRTVDAGLRSSVEQALGEIIRGQIRFYLASAENSPVYQLQPGAGFWQFLGGGGLLSPQRAVGEGVLPPADGEAGAEDYALLSLYALTRLNLERDNHAHVGEDYSVEAGISADAPEAYAAKPFTIAVESRSRNVPFDFMIHLTGHLELIGDWYNTLHYDPLDANPQKVEFKFRAVDEGRNQVDIDCYYQRRWLRTFQFTFDSVEVRRLEPAA